MVEVERSKSGEWYRMSYLGEVDFLPDEPTEQDKSNFVKMVTAARTRARIEASVPRGTGGHGSTIERVG